MDKISFMTVCITMVLVLIPLLHSVENVTMEILWSHDHSLPKVNNTWDFIEHISYIMIEIPVNLFIYS